MNVNKMYTLSTKMTISEGSLSFQGAWDSWTILFLQYAILSVKTHGITDNYCTLVVLHIVLILIMINVGVVL
jgi:hypothetical protein